MPTSSANEFVPREMVDFVLTRLLLYPTICLLTVLIFVGTASAASTLDDTNCKKIEQSEHPKATIDKVEDALSEIGNAASLITPMLKGRQKYIVYLGNVSSFLAKGIELLKDTDNETILNFLGVNNSSELLYLCRAPIAPEYANTWLLGTARNIQTDTASTLPSFSTGQKHPAPDSTVAIGNLLRQIDASRAERNISVRPATDSMLSEPSPQPQSQPSAVAPRRLQLDSSISGTVTDTTTGSFIPGAYITLTPEFVDGFPAGGEADENGHFYFDHLAQGTYRVTASRSGYNRTDTWITITGGPYPLNIQLSDYKYPCNFAVFNRTPWVVNITPTIIYDQDTRDPWYINKYPQIISLHPGESTIIKNVQAPGKLDDVFTMDHRNWTVPVRCDRYNSAAIVP
jgi:hypothetical protein